MTFSPLSAASVFQNLGGGNMGVIYWLLEPQQAQKETTEAFLKAVLPQKHMASCAQDLAPMLLSSYLGL